VQRELFLHDGVRFHDWPGCCAIDDLDDVIAEEADNSFIPLSDPDTTTAELEAVDAVLRSPRISTGPAAEAFEAAFAEYLGRKYAIAMPSGTMGLLITLLSFGIAQGRR